MLQPRPGGIMELVFFHPKMLNKDVTLTCAWVQSWYLETWQMLWENNSVNNWNLSLWTKLNPETRSCKIRQWLCAIYLMILTQPRSTCFRFVGGDMTSLNMTVEYFCWKYICNLYYIYYIYIYPMQDAGFWLQLAIPFFNNLRMLRTNVFPTQGGTGTGGCSDLVAGSHDWHLAPVANVG